MTKKSELLNRILLRACSSYGGCKIPDERVILLSKSTSRLESQLGFHRGFLSFRPVDSTSSSLRTKASAKSWRRSVSPDVSRPLRYLLYGSVLAAAAGGMYLLDPFAAPQATAQDDELVANWSKTHKVRPKHYYQPESIEELERVVKDAHKSGKKIRPVGCAISPNGLALCDEGMVNLALMDKVLDVDMKTRQVTVQAGARINQVVEALRPHGLTLESYVSVKDQQVAGLIQVGAHGTGAAIPPADERVVKLKIVTPTQGTLELSAESDPEKFYLARCGLGALGVVAELTLQCVPAHRLFERTIISNMKEVRKNHKKWLQENKHLRYLWFPYTDTVVVVQCNQLLEGQQAPRDDYDLSGGQSVKIQRLNELYNELRRKNERKYSIKSDSPEKKPNPLAGMWSGTAAGSRGPSAENYQEASSLPAIRDKVLAFDPLNPEVVRRLNIAEADCWKRSQGIRVGWSDEILNFECGGQQWVSEVCFPAGTVDKPDMSDLKFIEELLQLIKKHNIPAPGPIEQRWTARSRSSMSPASDPSSDRLFSWVGIVMYLPTEDIAQRKAITEGFFQYRNTVQKSLWDAYGAFEHWAEVEVRDDKEAEWIRQRLRKRFPVESFTKVRIEFDPKNIFGNKLIETLFPRQKETEAESRA